MSEIPAEQAVAMLNAAYASERDAELQDVINYIDSLPGEEISKAGVIHWLQEEIHRGN